MIDYIKGEIADLAPARMLMECYWLRDKYIINHLYGLSREKGRKNLCI